MREDLTGLTQAPAAPKVRRPSEPLDLVQLAEDMKGATRAPAAPPVESLLRGQPAVGGQTIALPRMKRLEEWGPEDWAQMREHQRAGREHYLQALPEHEKYGAGSAALQIAIQNLNPDRAMADQMVEQILEETQRKALGEHPGLLGAAGGVSEAARLAGEMEALGPVSEVAGGMVTGAAARMFPRAAAAVGRATAPLVQDLGAPALEGEEASLARRLAANVRMRATHGAVAAGKGAVQGAVAGGAQQVIEGQRPEDILLGAGAGAAFGAAGSFATGAIRGRPTTVFGEMTPGGGGAADPFRVLGLDRRTATEADVQAAYRDAAMRTHPDVAPEMRAQRGGSPDPVVSAQEFQRATAARDAALDAIRTMPEEEFERQPMGRTPPIEESAAAPGAQEAYFARAAERRRAQQPAEHPVDIERRRAAPPPAAAGAPGEPIHPALAPEARIAFTAPEGDPLKAQKESLAAQIAGDGPSFAPIARMRQAGATDADLRAHLMEHGVRRAEAVQLMRDMFRIPQPGGQPTAEMPVPRETGAVEAGAPHDEAAVQEGLFGGKTLAGNEQTEMMSETAGQPTAKLKGTKIGAGEVGRVKREGAEPAGERPRQLEPTGEVQAYRVYDGTKFDHYIKAHSEKEALEYARGRFGAEHGQVDARLEPGEGVQTDKYGNTPMNAPSVGNAPKPKSATKVSKVSGTEKLLARHAELTTQIARDEQLMGAGTHQTTFTDVNAHIGQPGQKFVRTKRTGPAYSAAGRLAQARKRLADLEKTMTPDELAQARTVAEPIAAAKAEETSEAAAQGGKTSAQLEREGIEREGTREKPDYEELAKKQAGPIPPALKQTIFDRLIEYGDTKEELDKRPPLDLANRALELEVLSPAEETRVLDAIWPDMGALLAARRKGAPLPQVTEPQKSVRDAFRKLLYPEKRGPEAEVAGRLLRRAIGEARRDVAQYKQMLKDARHQVPSLSTPEGIEFYDRAENGVGQADPKLQPAVDIIRKIYGGLVRDIQALGTGRLAMPIENYMAHGWKDPTKAKQVYREIAQSQARRPLAGSKAFLKERSIPRLVDGLRKNLEPITDNPIDLNLWKMEQMRKYLFGQQFFQAAKAEGIARFFRLGENLPDGWGRVEDPTFAVFGRTDAGELVLRGHWGMPTIARDLVMNYLSPGLRGNPIADAWLGAANAITAFKLGASGFHAGFSTYTGAISRVALAVGKIRTGRQPLAEPTKGGVVGGAAGAAIGGVVAGPPGAALGAMLGGTSGRLLQKGLALKAAYLDPAAGTVLERRMAEMMARAGGQHEMPGEYRTSTVRALKEAARKGNLPKALAHTLGLTLQTLAWPTMQFYVPLIKMGAFADIMESEVARLGPLATEAELDKAAQEVWHTIDNRFGQVSYDTRFWNNALKHVMMGTIQAVGWDVGTVDEHLGGLKDILAGKPSLRFDFFVALPLVVAMLGVMIQLALTGEGPTSVQDLFEPRNGKVDEFGNPERMTPASYMKDIISFFRHPVRTVQNKLNPLIGFLGHLLSNRDFYGNKWRNENDPLAEQLKQSWKFVRDEWTPISVKNVQEEQRRGITGGRALLPMVGITPAGREAVRTKAQNMMIQMLRERTPARTPEEQAAALEKRTEREALSPDQRLVGMFRKLSPDQRHQVYGVADTRERELFGPYVERRMKPYHR